MDIESLRRPFHQLVMLVRAEWEWTNYPSLGRMGHVGDQRYFKATHALTHALKGLGALAAAIEPLGHGRSLTGKRQRDAETAIAKLFINAIMIADVLGVETGNIPDRMQSIMRKQTKELAKR